MYERSSWAFTKEVSHQFDHHVQQSVPIYEQIQLSVACISDYFVSHGGLIYDLGCATGETIYHIEQRHPKKELRYIGVDSSRDMINQAIEKHKLNQRIKFYVQPIQEFVFREKSNLILAILTFQFVPIHQRMKIIHNIYENLYEGGAFILVEKTFATSPHIQSIFTHLHYEDKLQKGLSPHEILQKEESLRGVMTPISVQDYLSMLQHIGFVVDIFIKHWNFTGFIALKPIPKVFV